MHEFAGRLTPFKNECEAMRNKATSETVMCSAPVSLGTKKNRPKENSLRRENYITRGTTQIAQSASQALLSSLMLLRSHTGEFYGSELSSLRLGSYRLFPFTNGSHQPPSLLRLSETSLFVIAFITGILSSKFLLVNKKI